ncbi:MAG: hypothetical protein E6I86_05195 [Chloroflexi bacterium]|nr:MAG: hypothetical protein E6I86_05195 [Chloroflexota bacterium]
MLGWPEVRFRLATRGSTLAKIQAQLVADALARRYPEHEFTLTPLTTHGDRHPSMRLSESPREGVFVKDLEQALLDGRAELAVHSAKDLPTLPTSGLTLAAFLPREDPRDVLIAQPPGTLAQLPAGARIGTGSPRRAAQIAAVRPDLQTAAWPRVRSTRWSSPRPGWRGWAGWAKRTSCSRSRSCFRRPVRARWPSRQSRGARRHGWRGRSTIPGPAAPSMPNARCYGDSVAVASRRSAPTRSSTATTSCWRPLSWMKPARP